MGECLIVRKGSQPEGTATTGDVISGVTFQSANSDDLQTGTLSLTGSASVDKVLSGQTFYNTNAKSKLTGTMTNRGAITTTIAQGGSYTIPSGYHNGSGKVSATANSGNATTSQVLSGYTFYGNSATKQTGAMTNRGAVSATISAGGSYTIPSGYHNGSGKVSASKGGVGVVWTNGNGGTSSTLDTLTTSSKTLTAMANNVHESSNKNVYIQGSTNGSTWNNIWTWGSGSYNKNYGGSGAVHSGSTTTSYRYFRITTDGSTSGWGSYGSACLWIS